MTLDYRAGLLAAVLLAATYALGRVRLWLAARREAAATARAERAEVERDREAADRQRAELQSAADHEHATAQQRGHEAAGEIDAKPLPADPTAARDALYDRVRDAAHRRGQGAGADQGGAVRPVPGAGAGPGRDGR